jgi:regulatory protein
MARRIARFELPDLPPAGGSGGVISAVLRSSSEPDVVTIRVGRKSGGRIGEAAASELGIVEGAVWTEHMRAAVAGAMRLAEARDWAVRAVARRAMSRSMLTTKLLQRGLERGHAARIAEELCQSGLIDEKAFAESLVETTLARKGAGKRLMLNRIRSKGIDGRTAGAAVEKITSEAGYDATEAALNLARRKVRAMGDRLDVQAKQRRLYGLLARRGFDADVCRDVVARVAGER